MESLDFDDHVAQEARVRPKPAPRPQLSQKQLSQKQPPKTKVDFSSPLSTSSRSSLSLKRKYSNSIPPRHTASDESLDFDDYVAQQLKASPSSSISSRASFLFQPTKREIAQSSSRRPLSRQTGVSSAGAFKKTKSDASSSSQSSHNTTTRSPVKHPSSTSVRNLTKRGSASDPDSGSPSGSSALWSGLSDHDSRRKRGHHSKPCTSDSRPSQTASSPSSLGDDTSQALPSQDSPFLSLEHTVHSHAETNSSPRPRPSDAASVSSDGKSTRQVRFAATAVRATHETGTPTKGRLALGTSRRRGDPSRRLPPIAEDTVVVAPLRPRAALDRAALDRPRTRTTGLKSPPRSTRATAVSPSKRSGTTAKDVFCIQDKGQYQMLHDECVYLCTTIVHGQSVSAALDLATMLSLASHRSTLFHESSHGSSIETSDSSSWTSPLQAVLGLIAWAQTLDVGQCRDSVVDATETRSNAARGRDIGPDNQPDTTSTLLGTPPRRVHMLGSTTPSAFAKANTTHQRQQQLRDIIGMCLYFVSLDCTLSDESAAVDSNGCARKAASKAARRIRHAILSNGSCIQGILFLILTDPWTQCWRGNVRTAVAASQEVIDVDGKGVVGLSPLGVSRPFTEASQESGVGDDSTSGFSNTSKAASITSPQRRVLFTNSGDGSSCATPDTQASSGSVDPTRAGRRRKRQQPESSGQPGLVTSEENVEASHKDGLETENLSFASQTPPRERASSGMTTNVSRGLEANAMADRWDKVTLRIFNCLRVTGPGVEHLEGHKCAIGETTGYVISSYIPLVSINQIINGKCEGCDKACIEDDLGHEGDFGARERPMHCDDEYNPLLETNRLLGDSKAISLLSQALAESLTAVSHQLEQNWRAEQSKDMPECTACLSALQGRVAMLVGVIDGASLLSESNRRLFCEEGYTSEAGGYLLVGLIVALKKLLHRSHGDGATTLTLFHGVWGEITLSILRMLTSLTHDNKTAPNELEACLLSDTPERTKHVSSGLDILARVLCEAVQASKLSSETSDGKLIYDCVIFSLNVFANVVESGGSCRILCEMSNPLSNSAATEPDALFLTWLTRWLVSETRTFQDAVSENATIDDATAPKKRERNLQAQEDEHLVTAGNGFVLLSCLLVDEKDDDYNAMTDASSAYQIIMAELPGEDRDGKMSYLKNTLKAFCNFYQYSIGELSVAIVGPVKRLIQRLESIQDKRRRRSLGIE